MNASKVTFQQAEKLANQYGTPVMRISQSELQKKVEVFKKYLDEAYYVFDEKIPYPIIKVRGMKTRWGVCNRRDNSVTLNLELIKKDPMYLNYVIVHELSHFVHFDHSKAFWGVVEKYCPDYKIVRKKLKE